MAPRLEALPSPAAEVGAAAARPSAANAAGAALRVAGATRRFGATLALDQVSLELGAAERLALLGPNGAGKTTLIRSIAGRVRLDQGTIVLHGRRLEPRDLRQGLGVVPQEIALYPLLTARENLEAFGTLHGVAARELGARVEWALAWTGLAERAREPVRAFSGGMKRRLNIACGVLHRPRVVLLDEPTVGVDPQSREKIYEMLGELRAEGAALLLTTHQLEEAERRCDRVAILDRGRIIADGPPRELVSRTVGLERTVVLALDRAADGAIDGLAVEDGGLRLAARVRDVGAELPPLIERVRRAGRRVEDVEIRRPGLHEAFLHLTGKDLRE